MCIRDRERAMDFNHGTGHGVGYLLNVHEGPQNINWRMRANGRRGNTTPVSYTHLDVYKRQAKR